jgi:hypothetical protein
MVWTTAKRGRGSLGPRWTAWPLLVMNRSSVVRQAGVNWQTLHSIETTGVRGARREMSSWRWLSTAVREDPAGSYGIVPLNHEARHYALVDAPALPKPGQTPVPARTSQLSVALRRAPSADTRVGGVGPESRKRKRCCRCA